MSKRYYCSVCGIELRGGITTRCPGCGVRLRGERELTERERREIEERRRAEETRLAGRRKEFDEKRRIQERKEAEEKLRRIKNRKDAKKEIKKQKKVVIWEAKGDVNKLIKALDNKWRRWRAAEALGKIGDRRAIEPLLGKVKDEEWNVRSHVAIALGDIGDTRGVEPLLEMLKDESVNVRLSAINGLKKIGDARAVEPLIDLLLVKNWPKSRAVWLKGFEYPVVVGALEKLTGQHFGDSHATWLRWYETQNRERQ